MRNEKKDEKMIKQAELNDLSLDKVTGGAQNAPIEANSEKRTDAGKELTPNYPPFH